ncbi:MAG TPA: hypothetical protein IGS53_17895 [Leptolyngbyaceae cyanobacterium M33_DOE_097]|uniref:Uncharacterized protein n=1 Tax=Oscillatoriales cyanobacterium SpSt-418 TaxID=2282169 RepID=A0A7C3PHW8_9CYAN|nr:hypothetical protein [Leptolyngbyaceae cyanobacterium M33_DOE_097]
MNKKQFFALAGLGSLLVGCNQASQQAETPAPANQPVTTQPQAVDENRFNQPVIQQGNAPAPKVPGLLQATNAKLRVPAIPKGRSNPFAPINSGVLKNPTSVAAVTTANVPPKSNQTNLWASNGRQPIVAPLPPVSLLPPLPAVKNSPARPGQTSFPNSNTANLPTLPVPGTGGLPPLDIPVAPPSRTALADSIEITGVVQVRGKWHVIVKEPRAESSRYVAVGDRIAGGKVLIKRIINERGADPSVVLQQDGIDITKPVGSSMGPLAVAR